MIHSTAICDRCIYSYRQTNRIEKPLGTYFKADLCDSCLKEYQKLEDTFRERFAERFTAFMQEKAPKIGVVPPVTDEIFTADTTFLGWDPAKMQ